MKYPLYQHNHRILAPLEKDHIKKLKEWRNAQMEVVRQFTPLTDFHQDYWFKHMKIDTTQALFALMEHIKGISTLIGYCGIVHIDFKNRHGELSFLISPDRMKQKPLYKQDLFAVLFMLCTYAFEELNLHKVTSETFAFRKEHILLLEKFGLKQEGLLRDHYFKKGKYCDTFIHRLLKNEWSK